MPRPRTRRRWWARILASVVVTAVCVAIAVVALANGVGERDGADIYTLRIATDGSPELSGIYSPDGGLAPVRWRTCAPECGPVTGRGEALAPGPTPADTTFQLETTYRGETTTDRSPEWRGQVASVTPPTFSGELAVGATLQPEAGRWRGGWGDDRSQVGMQACRTPAGDDCRAMTEASFKTTETGDAVLNVGYVGWFVGAIETRVASRQIETLEGYGFPADEVSSLPAPTPGAIVAAGRLRGPVRPAAKADEPTVTLRPSVEVDGDDTITIGSVRCPVACDATIHVRRGGRYFAQTIETYDGTQDIEIEPEPTRERRGPLRVSAQFEAFGLAQTGTVTVEP